MSGGGYAPLPTTSDDSIDHQYKDERPSSHYGLSSGMGSSRPMGWQQYSQQREMGLVEKGKRQYWTSKQYVREKMGKDQDQHQVNDDAELDSQMERARHIQKQCFALCKALLRYQEIVQQLTNREVALSALLRAYAEQETDGPCAEMMSRLGTVMQDEALQRLELDVPLTRFFSEVETFRRRALVDTLINMNQVITERRKFRGALLWMADASRNLDPDTRRQLAKFRQAQQMARESRQEFEGKKGMVCEKVDLLAASFCNLLSHAMTPYQKAVGVQWTKSATQYHQLLTWSRETLRHQYRLQRDVERERERQERGASSGDSDGDSDGNSDKRTSEAWSEGRMLSVLGEGEVAPSENPVENAEEALSCDQRNGDHKQKTVEVEDVSVPQEDRSTRRQDTRTSSDADQRGTADTEKIPEYNWLDLMTDGSAASALADFARGPSTQSGNFNQSKVQETLLDMARESTQDVGDLSSAATSAGGVDGMESVDLFAYEMSTGGQHLLNSEVQQLTKDEDTLDKVMPMDSCLRQRQHLDMQAETDLEKELAKMVEDFNSLSARYQPAAESATPSGSGAVPGAQSSLLAGSTATGRTLPSDLLDVTDNLMTTGDLFGTAGGPMPFSSALGSQAFPPAGYTSLSSTASQATQEARSGPSGTSSSATSAAKARDSAQASSTRQKWFDLFSELDPLSNPDDLPFGDKSKDSGESGDSTTQKLAL